jgi:RNA polymerase sigma-70 factor, ECF subfamily
MSEKGNGLTVGGASSRARERATATQASGADAAVVEALRRGDEEAFTRLVDQLHEFLRRMARLYVSSPSIADEVVQDTWLAVLRGLWAFEGRSSLKTWILRILINRSKTRALREGRTIALSDLGAGNPEEQEVPGGAPYEEAVGEMRGRADPGLSPEARLLSEEVRVQVRAAIDALPPGQRVVITMRDVEGCSSEEVRNALGLSETNQRVILHRARSNVRTKLAAHFRKE